MSTTASRTPLWAVLLLIIGFGAAAAVGGVFVGKLLGAGEERTAQVLRVAQGEEQVILVTAPISEEKIEKEDPKFLNLIDIPGNERMTLVRVEYNAKFGIEGKEVDIRATGENAYRITIPEFIGLGMSDPTMSLASEDNGVLSWTTPSIDKSKLMEEILATGASEAHIDGFRPLLEEQAELFYTRIIESINPEATIEFSFSDEPLKD
ncbi:hypothetical protein [Microbacterium sp. SD291]|uniref:hypothetical protein n=1 Tax=Microbacterium sp. SD291 TaxID=2782007 RepID=UPI001A95A514|nr:hypothetical protein [Microbacterium sp. SD291]MBO0981970.1 hypothetical protein [Microbacterium sp. SD291]